MPSIIDQAKELGRALAQTDEYKALLAARDELESHAAAKIMYDDFAKRQMAVEQVRRSGGTVPEDQMKALESVAEVMSMNPYIRDLFMAQNSFVRLMTTVEKALGAEVGFTPPELPDDSSQPE